MRFRSEVADLYAKKYRHGARFSAKPWLAFVCLGGDLPILPVTVVVILSGHFSLFSFSRFLFLYSSTSSYNM